MVLKYTPKSKLSIAPEFNLLGVDGQFWSLQQLMGQHGLVVLFICNHCPFVKSIQDQMVKDAHSLMKIGVNVVAIMSNDPEDYPEDSFEQMAAVAQKYEYPFPYLWDKTQAVAKRFGAVCTPDIFGIDVNNKVLYRGRLDAAGIDGAPGLRRDLVEAMKEMVTTGTITTEQHPSMGCSIKWK